MLTCFFSLIWSLFTCFLWLITIAAFLVPVIFGVLLLRINDFPNRRKACPRNTKLTDKVAIVTGCNRGIGYETAKDFASRGAKVYMACRNTEKAEAAKSKIVAETGNREIHIIQCDLLDLESVQNCCKNFLAKETSLHILVNNAGIQTYNAFTKQNFDATVGANHVGHFLLTYLLLDTMKKSAPARIVNVSSAASLDVSEVGLKKEEGGVKLPQMKLYWCSKLANVMHVKELARRLNGSGVTAYSLHPGYIYDGMLTNLPDGNSKTPPFMVVLNSFLKMFKFLSLTPEQGAQTTIFCAVDESIANESGKYYDNCKEKQPNKLALDSDLCRRLWDVTLELVQDFTKIASD